MRALSGGFDFLGKHATRFLAGGVLLGLVAPPLATLARPLLLPALLIPLTLALIRLDWGAMQAHARRPVRVALIVLWILLASPLILWAALAPVPMPPALYHGLVLMAASSPIVSNAALSLLIGLDAELAAWVIIAATALMPLTLPPLALALLHMRIDMDLPTFMGRLALMVGSAFALALVIRRLAPAGAIERNARLIDGVTVLTLIVFCVAIMDGITAVALSRPGFVLLAVAGAFAANLALQALGTLVALRLGMRSALTVGLLGGNCNMGLIMVALGDKADFDVIVFFALGQIPMFILPGLLMPVYRRLLARGGGGAASGVESPASPG